MKKKLPNIIKYLAIYYLSAKMITFAIPKLLFMQFRIMHWESYVPLVELSKYQHMWSFFGRSYNYNLFIGLIEFSIGALVLFKRTRLIALLLSLGVCLNILLLNVEFDITFAIAHVSFDLAITLALLATYRKDLYRFFIEMGGKLDKPLASSDNKFFKILPVAFLLVLSIGYFAFSYHIKSLYIPDENLIGSYEFKSVRLNDSLIEVDKGSIGKTPMAFIEHNNLFVLSIEDTIYKGGYVLNDQTIDIYLKGPTKLGFSNLKGSVKADTLRGVIDDNQAIEFSLKRIEGSRDYLNDLYR
jgi:hypothetical protein